VDEVAAGANRPDVRQLGVVTGPWHSSTSRHGTSRRFAPPCLGRYGTTGGGPPPSLTRVLAQG